MDVALRAASTLKHPDFLCSYIFLHIAKLSMLLGFEPREYASRLSFARLMDAIDLSLIHI